MMNNRIFTLLATVAAVAAGTSLACAQTYPSAPGSYATAPYPPEYRRPGEALPDFDALEDDEAPRGQGSVALSAPGPVLSPDDPRYGRQPGAPPVYSDRAPPPGYGVQAAPLGPVMSPDDPRYGRPAGPPPIVYSDRPAAPTQTYSDRGDGGRGPGAGFMYPDEDRRAPRPPEAISSGPPGPGAPQGVTGSLQPPPIGADGRPMVLSALPPDEQPEANTTVQLPPNLRRQEVAFPTKEPAGTLIVDTPNTHLYYVLGNGRAIRYGVRVGRDGFTWTGVQKISRKAEWPDWHPPTEMIERQPYLPRFMAGGPGNPLGARAMYLGSTVYRIHGTNQPSTIGKFVSSGCIGMLNEDVSDLFDRVKVGTRVVVLPGGAPPAATASASAAPLPAQASAQPQLPPASVPGSQPTVVQPLPAPVTIR
jgi:lipoprotein-anchoring transpeptidase ErfK/SrfK